MATDKEVEKKRNRVESLREKLAEVNAPITTASENDIQLKMLEREENELQAQIDEAQATNKARHKDGGDPIAFAQALLRRDEEIVQERDKQVAEAAAPATTAERKES